MRVSTLLLSAVALHLASAAPPPPPPPPPAPQGSWAYLKNLTLMRQEHTTVSPDADSIYVMGGILPVDANGNPFPTVALNQKYSISKNSWTDMAPMPLALNHVNIAVVNGKIFQIGGMSDNGGGVWVANGIANMYDPSTNKWTALPSMPKGREVGASAVGVDGNIIYIAGGLKNTILSNDTETTVTQYTSYDTVAKKYTTLPNMPAPRDHAGNGLVNHYHYVLGGRAYGHSNVVNTVFRFNIKANKWESGFAPMPTARGGCASAVIGNMIYTAGGEGNPNDPVNHIFYDMQAYNTATNCWTILKNMTTALHGTSAVAKNGKVYIPGGGLAQGGFPTNLFEVFTAP